MPNPDHDPSVGSEPQFQKGSFSSDPAEVKASRHLAQERSHADSAEERATHSVFDEPDILPNRPSILIECDWCCRNCGYNLRGLMTGHNCPECGKIELYQPPRAGETTYARWVQVQGACALSRRWLWFVLLVPLIAVGLAVIPALLTAEYFLAPTFVIMGPVMSELLKVAIPLTLLERNAGLVRSPRWILWMTLSAALVFAVVQNVICLSFYISNPSAELIAYRWVACLVLHAGCTGLASQGLILAWRQTSVTQPKAKLSVVYPWLIAAIVVHCSFNAAMFARGAFGYGF